MQELKQRLTEHMVQDRRDFEALNEKLDKLLMDVVIIKTQWKMVGASVGALTGTFGTILLALLK